MFDSSRVQRFRTRVPVLVFLLAAAIAMPHAAFAQDGYITLRNGREVLVFDPANPTDTSTRVSLVGLPSGVAVSPDGTTAYVLEGATVRVIAGAALQPTQFALNGLPEQLVVSPDGGKLYVTNFGTNAKLHRIDLTTGTVLSNINFNSGDGAWDVDVASTAGGDLAYISLGGTSATANVVKVLDIATDAVIATVPVGLAPRGVAASPLGDLVYVANSGDDTVSVIDTTTQAVIGTVGVGAAPQELTVSADGLLVYVTLRNDGDVAVIDTATFSVADTIDLGTAGDSVFGISFSADGRYVVVAHFNNNRVSVIDPLNGNSFVTTGPPEILGGPRYVAFQPLSPLAPPDPDFPPAFNLPLCDTTFDAVLDEELTIALSVSDDNGALVTFSQTPATGGVLEPPLPGGLSTLVESTFRWTPSGADAGDYQLTFTADDQVNPAVSCSVSVSVPEPPEPPQPDEVEFAKFSLRLAKINTRGRFADSFWVNGNFQVDLENGDGISPVEEDVTLNLEGVEWVIPAGEFRSKFGGRLFRFRGTVDGTRLLVYISRRGREGSGRYNINVSGWKADLSGADNPLSLCATIGDDFGCAERRGWIR